MHETAIARNIISIAEEEARRRGAARIISIRVRLGEFRGVVPEALTFAYEVMRIGTLAEGANLEIGVDPLRVACNLCGEREMAPGELNLICSECGGILRIISGQDLVVESLDLAWLH